MTQTPGIHVDVDELRTFAESLNDLERGLKTGAHTCGEQIQQGINFGRGVPGGQVVAGYEVFAAALARARENTARQIRGIEILVAAIKRVLDNYVEGDRIAAARLAAIEHALSDAIRVAEAKASAESAAPPVWGPQP